MTLSEQLQEPFEPDEVKWKPQAVRGDRALAIAYVDARVVMDRLDDVLGVGGWQTSYQVVNDGVICRLSIRVADTGEWIEHADVGSFSDQPDDGDKLKAAFSDALKRAAVHLGISRYLYRLPHQWVDFDAQKKQLKVKPALPAWALPKPKAKPVNGTPVATTEAEKLSAEWRDHFVSAFTGVGTWQKAQEVFMEATPEIKELLLPADKAAVGAAWKRCQDRLKPKDEPAKAGAAT